MNTQCNFDFKFVLRFASEFSKNISQSHVWVQILSTCSPSHTYSQTFPWAFFVLDLFRMKLSMSLLSNQALVV